MHQEGLLTALLGRLRRGVTLVAADMEKLSACKQQLGRDLKDKVCHPVSSCQHVGGPDTDVFCSCIAVCQPDKQVLVLCQLLLGGFLLMMRSPPACSA
jgi:hypothetical protein